jgi:carboxylesterase type B
MDSFPVNDGKILLTHQLPLSSNNSITSSVPLMVGILRDEGGMLSGIASSDNVTQAVLDMGPEYTAQTNISVFTPGLFLPAGTYGNATFQATNVTSRIHTDGGMLCGAQATAWSGIKNSVFPEVYAFSFNRSYQPAGYSNFACNAPVTESHPYGDPNMEYLKCHAGEVTYVLGALRRWQPDRDGNDTPFARLIGDYWASFAKTGDPNPDMGYLKARNYTSTMEQINRSGKWAKVTVENPQIRWLEWGDGERNRAFYDLKQCEALGVPLDIFG